MKIDIQIIPHKEQRYDTCGDYWQDEPGFPKGDLHVRISNLQNAAWELLVLIHELIEWFLITRKGISIADIDAFDKAYEENRHEGDHSEPGDDPAAPYHKQHQVATSIERMLAIVLHVDWDEYEKAINSLQWK